MRDETPRTHLAFARRLRREMTDAERLVWSRVRGHRLAGSSFRRQVPMLGYIADFACHEAKLVVELDGGQHTFDDHVQRDRRRDLAFEGQGYKVLRFFNPEVVSRLDDVMETIYRAAMVRLPNHPDTRLSGGDTPSLPSPAERGRVQPKPHMRQDEGETDRDLT